MDNNQHRISLLNNIFEFAKKLDPMKFSSGQRVTLLDTEFKPAGSAVIRSYEETSNKYEVEFTYPDRQTVDNISVPEERLIVLPEFMHQ